MIIPDARWEMPELLAPGKKPVSGAKIDWAHPLARGIVSCLVPSVYGVNDIAVSSSHIISNDVVPSNEGLVFGGGATDYVTLDSDFDAHDNDHSLFWIGKTDSAGAVLFPVLIARGDTASNEWMLRRTSTNNVSYYAGSSERAASTGGEFTDDVRHTVGLSVIDESGASPDVWLYVDGLLVDSDTAGSYIRDSTKDLQLGIADTASARVFEGVMEFFVAYNRALSAEEHISLNRNPYQFLIPA